MDDFKVGDKIERKDLRFLVLTVADIRELGALVIEVPKIGKLNAEECPDRFVKVK